MDKNIKLLENKGQGSIELDLNYKEGIALLVINNPSKHNALSGKMMVDLHLAIIEIEKSQDLVGLVVMGAELKSFCAGLDLSFAREFITGPEISLAINELMHDTVERISRLPMITMAVLTGGAIGGGSELITGFDFICMAQKGFVHFVQTRMGISSPWGGMRRLIDIVGKKKALQWMAGGMKLTAQECLREGFADIVVEKEQDCLGKAVEFLQPFLVDSRTQQKVSSSAVRGMKKLIVTQLRDSDWEKESKILFTTTAKI